ncbi:alpha/beta-hydrolase [Thozetella sp. PMI_491]|nr:alpha/beta-hydrolase [Thozetella sp. PMI_491]
MSTAQWPDDSMFEHFTVFEETFKTVDTHDIKAAILIPKGLPEGSHPVILNLHGGFLAYGHALFAPFFSPWALKLALEQSAIVVSADYRLLPSVNGVADVLEDLEDFWQWTRTTLPAALELRTPGHSVDFHRLLLTGSSAGGYAATQLALSHPDDISVVAMAYPFVDPKDDVIVSGPKAGEPTILRFPLEDMPSKEAVAAWVKEARQTVTTRAGLERTPLAVAAAQYGQFDELFFDNRNLNRPEFLPMERIKAGAKLPKKMWILHGDDDSVVYLRTSRNLLNLIREKLPDTSVRLDIAPGEDHAFDLTKTSWELHAIGAMDFVRDAWLGN